MTDSRNRLGGDADKPGDASVMTPTLSAEEVLEAYGAGRSGGQEPPPDRSEVP